MHSGTLYLDPWIPNSSTPGPPNYPAGVKGFRSPGTQESRSPGIQYYPGIQMSRGPASRNPGFQETRCAGVQASRNPGAQNCRRPGFQDSRSPGVQESRNPGLQQSRSVCLLPAPGHKTEKSINTISILRYCNRPILHYSGLLLSFGYLGRPP